MEERGTLRLELDPKQYLQIAAATGLLVDALELDITELRARAAREAHVGRLAVRVETTYEEESPLD